MEKGMFIWLIVNLALTIAILFAFCGWLYWKTLELRCLTRGACSLLRFMQTGKTVTLYYQFVKTDDVDTEFEPYDACELILDGFITKTNDLPWERATYRVTFRGRIFYRIGLLTKTLHFREGT